MIRLDSIKKSYPNGELFSNVNISIKRGMRVGLVGKNGSGKTTLLRIMLNKESPDFGHLQVEKNLNIGYLAQEIVTGSKLSIVDEVKDAFPELRKLEKNIKDYSFLISNNPNDAACIEKLGEYQSRYEALGGWSLDKKIKKILGGLGFSKNQFNSQMEEFSGGWRMRVALARILTQKPDVLFLDEPTNHLDLDATIWLETFISKWEGSLVLISHDKEFLDRSVNTILEVDLKKVVLYKGNYSEYKTNKEIRLDQHRSSYKNQQKQIKETGRFIDRFRSKSTKAIQVQSRIKQLEKLEKIEATEEDKKQIVLNLPQPSRSPQIIVRFKNIFKNYSKIEVFKNMSLTIERGNKIGLVGRNGAGKSTLIKLLAGVEKITNGYIEIGNGIKTAYYAQHQLEILNLQDTVYETINQKGHGISETKIRTYLGGFLFSGEEIDKKVKVLSGGEKARLALASILIDPVHLLLLDEPTNHLDMLSRSIIENALKIYSGVIVCISHDRHFLNKVTNKTCEVGDGDVKLYEGNYSYYDWKVKKNKSKENKIKVIKNPKKKDSFLIRKKKKNRLAAINKKLKSLDLEIEKMKVIATDPMNSDNYIKLNEAMSVIESLENKYIDLMEEQESLELDLVK
jgi:ATP-binding cassette, subfamily F, member 3